MSHRFPASSALSADPEQQRLIADYLAGMIELPDVDGHRARGPLLLLSAGPATVTTGGKLALEVALRHPGRIGHQFPAGAQDLVEIWLEGELAAGPAVLARWGEAQPGGPLLAGTPVFRRGGFHRFPDGVREIHPPWQLEGVPFPLLRPGDTHTLILTAPAPPAGSPGPQLQLDLKLMYRKLSRPALDAIGAPGLPLPPARELARGRWPIRTR